MLFFWPFAITEALDSSDCVKMLIRQGTEGGNVTCQRWTVAGKQLLPHLTHASPAVKFPAINFSMDNLIHHTRCTSESSPVVLPLRPVLCSPLAWIWVLTLNNPIIFTHYTKFQTSPVKKNQTKIYFYLIKHVRRKAWTFNLRCYLLMGWQSGAQPVWRKEWRIMKDGSLKHMWKSKSCHKVKMGGHQKK